ncbi:MAG: ribosome maturation factor RimP [Propionibacteriaceae bacterium]|jgi:ribosome maturation factor RimP|nr:ribosome maturation factor RimP [Propionibacteriaceae bacterium]
MQASELLQVVAPVAAALGLEVEELGVRPAGRRKLVQVFLDGDGPDGRGPSLDQIAEATRAISKTLDACPAAGNQPYTLEVSTRGVGRPLTKPAHFRRNLGRLVELTMAVGESHQLDAETAAELNWRIRAADEQTLTLESELPASARAKAAVGQVRTLAYSDIAKAVVQVELNRTEE